MKYTYKTKGTCSKEIIIELEDNIIKDVKFSGGCNGNLKGISSIVRGMNIDYVIERFKGITCSNRPTSCPDQLSKALEEAKKVCSINDQ